jgi:hypothetical protein
MRAVSFDERFNCLFEIAGLSRGTLAAMRSGRPAACATRMATSGPFSGSMRPRNARYSSDRSVNGRRVSGSPWWMVASQFKSGAGVRWLWEIETNGAFGNRWPMSSMFGKSRRPCRVVRNGTRRHRRSGRCTQSRCEWITSNLGAASATASSRAASR